jgi:polysaccharide chain length determinant protein (PEP-CTERM system associated)
MPRPREQDEPAIGFDFVVNVWQRRKWVAILVFITAFAGVASLAMSLPDMYRATSTVLVERQQVSEAFVRPSVTAELETRIQTIHKQVMSRARLTDVITRLDLYPDLRGRVPIDAIVERMRRDVDFALSGVDQTTGRTATIAFTLSYSGRDPVTVAEVANTLVAFYVDENTKSRERQAARTAEFLRTQLADIKQTLDSQERRAGEFKQRHNGELPEQVDVNLAALDRFNNQLRLNGEYQIRAMERRERLEHQLAAERATGQDPGQLGVSPAAELLKLREQLVDLRRKFSDQYPDVIRLRQEIASLEQAVRAGADGHAAETSADPSTRITEQTLREVESQLKSLKAEEAVVRQVIGTYAARVENAPKRQEELQQLSRDSDASKERYETLLKRYEEAQLTENMEQGQNVEQFRVLDPAIPSRRPVAPNRPWLLGMGLFVSFALALGAVVAAEKIDTTFHTVEELRAFARVQSLAVIRRIPTPSETRSRRIRRAMVTVSVIVALILVVAGARYVGSGNEQIVLMTARGRG